jgi:hypothetical protein
LMAVPCDKVEGNGDESMFLQLCKLLSRCAPRSRRATNRNGVHNLEIERISQLQGSECQNEPLQEKRIRPLRNESLPSIPEEYELSWELLNSMRTLFSPRISWPIILIKLYHYSCIQGRREATARSVLFYVSECTALLLVDRSQKLEKQVHPMADLSESNWNFHVGYAQKQI